MGAEQESKHQETVDIGGGVQIYYEGAGHGQPVIFLHGVWASGRFFRKQIDGLSHKYQVFAPDFRGHGRSSMSLHGQTVETYAQDLKAFIEALSLEDVILVGWSMGAFVIWDYYRQFGDAHLKATIIVEQSPTDFRFPDYPEGMISLEMLTEWSIAVQLRRNELMKSIVPMMFARPLSYADFTFMYDEMTRAPEVIAGAILVDQSLRDYREVIQGFPLPTLVCFGADESLQPLSAACQIQSAAANARLEIFEDSNHCPFWEEPEKFNAVLCSFIDAL